MKHRSLDRSNVFKPSVGSPAGRLPRDPGFDQDRCAEMQGLGLHAAGRCDADDHQGPGKTVPLHHPPALAYERVQCNAAGFVSVASAGQVLRKIVDGVRTVGD